MRPNANVALRYHISRIFVDIILSYYLHQQNDLGMTQSQAVHVVSHCPYLIAQYARYKGRDVYATAKAIMEVGYTLPKLVSIISVKYCVLKYNFLGVDLYF